MTISPLHFIYGTLAVLLTTALALTAVALGVSTALAASSHECVCMPAARIEVPRE